MMLRREKEMLESNGNNSHNVNIMMLQQRIKKIQSLQDALALHQLEKQKWETKLCDDVQNLSIAVQEKTNLDEQNKTLEQKLDGTRYLCVEVKKLQA